MPAAHSRPGHAGSGGFDWILPSGSSNRSSSRPHFRPSFAESLQISRKKAPASRGDRAGRRFLRRVLHRRFARRLGPCGTAGLPGRCLHRPLRMRDRVLAGFAGYLRRNMAMYPFVCALQRIHLPLQGRLYQTPAHPEGSPLRGAVGVSRLRGCGILLCQYPSGLVQAPPGGRERPPYNARQTDGGTGNSRHGGWMTVVEHRPSAQGPMISSARRRA